MEDNTKELIKRDILIIAKLCNTQDCSKPATAKKIYSSAMEKSIFMSPIGKSFQQRMESVAKGEINKDLCLVCRKNIATNHAICPKCLTTIANLQAKQAMNSTITNQKNIENGTLNKNTSEIAKQDQEIKRKVIAQAGDASNNIKKEENSAKSKRNDMNSNVPQSHNAEIYQNESVNNPQPDKNNGNTIEEKTKRKKGKGIISKIFIPLVILFYILKILLESQSSDTTSQNINQSFTFTEAEAVEWLNNDLGQIGWNIHTVENGDSFYLVSDETIEGTVADKTILDACYKFDIDDNGYVSHIFVVLNGNEISGNAFVLAMAGIKGCCDGSITGETLKEIYAKTISDGEYIYNNLKLEYVYIDDSKSFFVISPNG